MRLCVLLTLVHRITTTVFDVGVLLPMGDVSLARSIAYETNAAALQIAYEDVVRQQLLKDHTIRFIYTNTSCSSVVGGGTAAALLLQAEVDAIIGPPCNEAANVFAPLATYFDVPTFLWGLASSSRITTDEFPSVMTIAVTGFHYAVTLIYTARHFGWDQLAFLYAGERCSDVYTELTKLDYDLNSFFISYASNIRNVSLGNLERTLSWTKNYARIIAMCLPGPSTVRDALLAASNLGMITHEYLYIIVNSHAGEYQKMDADGHLVPMWKDTNSPPDGRDNEAKLAFKNTMVLSASSNRYPNATLFNDLLIKRMGEPPFNCKQECADPAFRSGSEFSFQLYDIVILYATALNITLSKNSSLLHYGTEIIKNSDVTFQGIDGLVTISDAQVVPTLYIQNLDKFSRVRNILNVVASPKQLNATVILSDPSDVWQNYDYKRPLAVPTCGFKGEKCHSFFSDNIPWVVGISCTTALIVLTLLVVGFCQWRARKEEEKKMNLRWLIPYTSLVKVCNELTNPQHERIRLKQLLELVSFQKNSNSVMSINTNATATTDGSDNRSVPRLEHYELFNCDGEAVLAHYCTKPLTFDKKDAVHLRRMHDLSHDNLNRFIGITTDGAVCLTLWKNCTRGSIRSIIAKGSVSMDGFFILCLIKDIASGLQYIHNSFLKHHGLLTSSCCLVSDRWQVKISNFGLSSLQFRNELTDQERLYLAPEHLRDHCPNGSKEGDMFSFGIICAELIGRTSPWDLENRKEDADEIIYMVKKGGKNPLRPEIKSDPSIEIGSSLLHMVRDCWEEEPSSRPVVEEVQFTLKSVSGKSGKRNLMDHVFKMMEHYASSLEQEVEARTRELVEEKKKSDLLLYRMLPRDVVDKLRHGESIEPEAFDSVTVFFSDIVSFTVISSKCTPMQVVDLLNRLYTIFDSKIDEADVYKVETIGDAYLCVSGLPQRNGTEHIKEICTMSVKLLCEIKSFRIPHLPQENISIRVGVHTGPCVAGVVGLAMPKYCLFGDTVNTAIRMESNGKPGQVHLSEAAAILLSERYPEYKTVPRGEILIKGKGMMNTFWLIVGDDRTS